MGCYFVQVMSAAFLLPEPSLLPAAQPQTVEALPGFGDDAIDSSFPHGGLPRGALTELRGNGVGAGLTTLALRACRVVQSRQRERRCAFIDPSGSLFEPAVSRLGVDLERLMVVRPSWSEVESAATLVADARIMSLLVIDLQTAPAWAARSVRDAGLLARVAAAVEGSATAVLLLTRGARLDEPLLAGVSARLTATRISEQAMQVVVQGRPLRRGPTKLVPWARLAALEERPAPGAAHGA